MEEKVTVVVLTQVSAEDAKTLRAEGFVLNRATGPKQMWSIPPGCTVEYHRTPDGMTVALHRGSALLASFTEPNPWADPYWGERADKAAAMELARGRVANEFDKRVHDGKKGESNDDCRMQ